MHLKVSLSMYYCIQDNQSFIKHNFYQCLLGVLNVFIIRFSTTDAPDKHLERRTHKELVLFETKKNHFNSDARRHFLSR